MRIIFGIGNPGPEYEGTRHNLGFEVLDAIAAEANASFVPVKGLQADGARVRLGPRRVLLLKPLTYVNRCGPVLARARERLGLGLDRLLVVVDDLNLPLGRLRLRGGGSDGGHNGLRSLLAALASPDFPRLRIGIGGPGALPAERYVLTAFDEPERPRARAAVERARDAARLWLRLDLQTAMGAVNRRDLDQAPGRP